jgi:hypothetical protein
VAEPPQARWSLNDLLRELGYPEDIDRSTRIRLGQLVVETYKQAHGGRAPIMAAHGHGEQGRRVSIYVEKDIPMVDRVIRGMLGEPSGQLLMAATAAAVEG